MKFSPKRLVLPVLCLLCFSFIPSSEDGLINEKYAFLIGEYKLLVIYNNGKVVESNTDAIYKLVINGKDQLLVYKNNRKVKKYQFHEGRSPIPLDSEDYLLFKTGQENFPLFFKGDTIVQFIYPNEFDDNYFRKVK